MKVSMGRIQRQTMLLLGGLHVLVLAQMFSKGSSYLFRLHCACLYSGKQLWFTALSFTSSQKVEMFRQSSWKNNKSCVKWLFIDVLLLSNIDSYFRENNFNFLYKELLKSLCFQLHSYTTAHRSNIFQTGSSWWRASTASVVVIREMILNRNMVGSVRGLSSVTPPSLKVLAIYNAIYSFRRWKIWGHLWLH